MSIKFTQFLRPDGRKVPVTIDRPEPIEKRAQEIIDAGYRFEIEELTTGQVHMTITGFDPSFGEEADLAHRICVNGPPVPTNIDEMISTFVIPTKELANAK